MSAAELAEAFSPRPPFSPSVQANHAAAGSPLVKARLHPAPQLYRRPTVPELSKLRRDSGEYQLEDACGGSPAVAPRSARAEVSPLLQRGSAHVSAEASPRLPLQRLLSKASQSQSQHQLSPHYLPAAHASAVPPAPKEAFASPLAERRKSVGRVPLPSVGDGVALAAEAQRRELKRLREENIEKDVEISHLQALLKRTQRIAASVLDGGLAPPADCGEVASLEMRLLAREKAIHLLESANRSLQHEMRILARTLCRQERQLSASQRAPASRRRARARSKRSFTQPVDQAAIASYYSHRGGGDGGSRGGGGASDDSSADECEWRDDGDGAGSECELRESIVVRERFRNVQGSPSH